ncbi:hypothetical protein Q3G72_023833 [Acer saccharum]|nr:hypothetical protein Q3G72_023833 [Acer saccharum]
MNKRSFYRIIRVEAPPTPTSPSAHNDDEVRRRIQVGAPTPPPTPTPTAPSAHDDDEVRWFIRGGAPPPTPTSPSAHDDVEDCSLIPAGAPTPNSPSAHDNDVDGRFIRGGAPPAPNSPSAHDDDLDGRFIRDNDVDGWFIRDGAPPAPTSPSAHDDNVGGRLSRLTPAEAPPTPTFPSAHDDEYGRLGRLTPAEAPPTPTSPSAHEDDGQLIRVGAPPTSTSLSAYDYDQDRRLIQGGAPSTPISPSAHDDDEVRRLIQVGATPTPTSPAHHDEYHQIFLAGAGVPNSSTRDKDIGAPTTSHNSKRISNALIIFLAIGIFILLLLPPITYLFCRRKRERAFQENEKLLIYEFMLNKSLDVHLFGSSNRPTAPLDWKTHHEMNPKISDFGLARLLEDNQSEANTNGNIGTYGYMAPEYCTEGVISSKSDIYSFGVVLLEIISGKKNRFQDLGLLGYTWELWENRTPLELMDEVVAQSCDDTKEVLRCIHIGSISISDLQESFQLN